MRESHGPAAMGKGHGIVGRERAGLLGQLAGTRTILAWRRAEMLRRALAAAPGGERLGQTIGRGALLRRGEVLERRATFSRSHGVCGRQGAPGEPECLIVDLVVSTIGQDSRPLQSVRGRFAEVLAILDREPAKLAEPGCKRDLGDARRAVGTKEPLTRKRQARSTHPIERRGAEIELEVGLERARPNA